MCKIWKNSDNVSVICILSSLGFTDILVIKQTAVTHVIVYTLLKRRKSIMLVNSLKDFFLNCSAPLSILSGITLSVRNTKMIKDFPQPKKMVEIHHFFDLANYFQKFIVLFT